MPDLADEEVVASIAASLDALDDPEFVKTGEMTAALAGKAAASHGHDAATTGAAGFMSAADKTKLDGIETAATADQSGAEIVAAIDGNLGGTGWRDASDDPQWGSIGGTLADQTDLNSALGGKAAASHNHSASDITSGTLSTDRYSAYADLTAESKVGTGSDQVAAGNHGHSGIEEAEFSCYLASDQAAITGTNSADALFDTVEKNVSGYSVSSGIVTLPSPGTYKVEYLLTGEATTANTKGMIPSRIQHDNSGSYEDVVGSWSRLANPGGSSTTVYQTGHCAGKGFVTTTGADKHVKVRLGANSASASDWVLKGTMCKLTVRKVA